MWRLRLLRWDFLEKCEEEFFEERTKRIHSFSRSPRENEPKEWCYPQAPLQRGMQLTTREDPLRQGSSKNHKAFALRVIFESFMGLREKDGWRGQVERQGQIMNRSTENR